MKEGFKISLKPPHKIIKKFVEKMWTNCEKICGENCSKNCTKDYEKNSKKIAKKFVEKIVSTMFYILLTYVCHGHPEEIGAFSRKQGLIFQGATCPEATNRP